MIEHFHFIRPLWLLALLPLALLLWRLRGRGGALAAWRTVCDPHLLAALTVGSEGEGGGRLPRALLALGWLSAVVALAGPSWERLPQPLYKPQAARVILLDLSRSMDAGDLAPSRLERARFKILDILKRSRGGQTALIAFAAEPYVVAPLTDDTATVANLLRPLTTALMPVQGSRPDLALRKGEALLKQAGVPGGELLLVGDGADAAAVGVAEELRGLGRTVSVLAVGSADGAPIPIEGGGFLKDADGAIVIPKLEEDALRRVATAGGGHYRRISADDRDLRGLLVEPSRGDVTKRDGESAVHGGDAWREEGPWLVLALLPLALVAFRRGWLGALLLVSLLPPPVHAAGWTEQWANLWSRPDQRAAARFEQAPAEAAKQFEDPGWRASAHYRAGEYDEALKAWQGIDSADAHYNQGNALARQGKLKEALAAYEQALKADPKMADAEANRKLVEELLKQQQPPRGQKGGDSRENQEGDSQQQPQQDQGGSSNPDQGGNPQPGDSSQQPSRGQSSDQPNEASEPQSQPRDGSQPSPGTEKDAQKGEQGDVGDEGEKEDPQNAAESAKQAQAADATEANEESPDQQPPMSADSSPPDPTQEDPAEKNLRMWLRRVPDDPGGLLRRKFQLEHRRHGEQTESEKQW
ncbi:VWA domain-containing protein [Endothiovibrio diazotrophicus]